MGMVRIFKTDSVSTFQVYNTVLTCMLSCFSRVQLCAILSVDCSPPVSSVHGSLQARILEWVAMPPPGDLPNTKIKPVSPASPALQADSLLLSHKGSPYNTVLLTIVSHAFLRPPRTYSSHNWKFVHFEQHLPISPRPQSPDNHQSTLYEFSFFRFHIYCEIKQYLSLSDLFHLS